MKHNEPTEFAKAVQVERAMQVVHQAVTTPGKFKGVPFLHQSLRPLETVDFSTEEENGQTNMFQNECEGMCGV